MMHMQAVYPVGVASTTAAILEQFRRVTAIDPELGDPARWVHEPVEYFLVSAVPPPLTASVCSASVQCCRLPRRRAHDAAPFGMTGVVPIESF